MLLLIYCLMYLPLVVGVLCWSLFWYILQYFDEEERAVFFAFIWMSCYCKCPVALPRGAMGWSAVCNCGIS